MLGYTLLPPSLTPGIRPVYTPSPLALYLRISGPACHETAVGSLVCLGQVKNELSVPVEDVIVTVQLLSRAGVPVASGEAYVSRWILPTGTAGPYRVLFDQVPADFIGALTTVRSMQIAQDLDQRYATLALSQVSGQFVLDQYQISLSIINKGNHRVQDIWITMTLLDQLGQVTGFRRVNLGTDRALRPGESIALTLKVIPQGPDTVGFDAFAEGRVMLN